MNFLQWIFTFLKHKVVYSNSRSLGIGWDKVRREHLTRHPYCEICGYLPVEEDKHNDVHHIVPRHIRPEGLLDKDNLITLCRKYGCHLRFGHFGNYKKYWNPLIREMFIDCGEKMRNEEILMFVRSFPRCSRKGNRRHIQND